MRIQLHYVIGGKGDPVVLAQNYTIIAPDLRGHGDSSKPLTGYDGKTLA